MKPTQIILISALTLLLGACASSNSGTVYKRGQVQSAQEVQLGTVVMLHEVLIEGTKTNIGTAAGAAVGTIAARNRRNSIGGQIAGVIGAVIGGMAGAAAEEAITRKKGLELTVELDNGRTISVVQEADQDIAVNDRVRVLTNDDGSVRVIR